MSGDLLVETNAGPVDPLGAVSSPLRRQAALWRALNGDLRDRAIVVLVGLLAVAVAAYQLAVPDALTGVHGFTGNGYDDGVYLGVAIRLIHGVVPYRDFAFLQPPGIAVLMSPVALIARWVGGQDAMAIARCLTALITGVNAGLAARLVRPRGATAMLVAGLCLAAYPLTVAAAQTLLLEPYLVLFCLLGATALFNKGELASPTRVFFAGGLFGVGGAVKVWAVFAVAAALAACIPRWRAAAMPLFAGAIAGFAVICVPFFALAPHAFVHDVVTAQLGRGTSGLWGLSVLQRLMYIFGLPGLGQLNATTLTLWLSVVLGVAAALAYGCGWRTRCRLEWFVLASALLVVGGMSLSPEFYDHYAYFPAAFVALLIGECASRLVDAMRALTLRQTRPAARRALRLLAYSPAALAVVGSGIALPTVASYAANYVTPFNPIPGIEAAIPAGACVVTDDPVDLVLADRFVPSTPGCPAVDDAFGLFIADDRGQPPPVGPPYPAAFVATWRSAFEHAQYVLLSVEESDYLPWTPALLAYFTHHFTLVYSEAHAYVYRRTVVTRPTADAEVSAGLAAERKGDTVAAADDYRAALRLDPRNVYAHYDLGYLDEVAGRSAAASSQYRQTLNLDPRFSPALYNLGILESSTDPRAAIVEFRKVLVLQPNNAFAEYNLGTALLKTGQRAGAIRALAAAIKLDPALRPDLPRGIRLPASATHSPSKG